MKKMLCITLLFSVAFTSNAQEASLTLDDNEFMVGKKVVAKVESVKLGGFQGRELRLLGSNKEVLLALPQKSFPVGNPPKHIWYANIVVPALNNDSIQIYYDSLKADGVKFGFIAPDDEAWAEYFFKKQLVNSDGTLNMENVKALKNRYPNGILKDFEMKTAAAAKCAALVNTPTKRNAAVPAKLTEVNRQTNGSIVTINYKIEHDGTLLGDLTATGNVANLSNERSEVDFKTKMIYKKTDIEPMTFEIKNVEGCLVAKYSPMSKILNTVRGDKGTTHGIMKPILDGKAETVQTRVEVMGAMVDYMIRLGYF